MLRLWDEAQTRFHVVPVKAFVDLVASAGVPPENFSFDSDFARQRAFVEEFGLSGLRPAVDWLMANTPRQSTAVICHGDFQSFNVLADDGRLTGVIDWVKATIAEPAFDYGAVMAILATVPIRVPAGVHRMLRAMMNNLARTHSRQCGTTPETEAGPALLPGIQLPRSAGHGRQEPRAGKSDAGRIQLARRRRKPGKPRTSADRTQPHSSGKLDSCCAARKRSPAHA